MIRRASILGLLGVAAPALGQEAPFFYVEKECRALPLEAARAWCLREERCNEKWLARRWKDITAGASRDSVDACVTLAKAAQAYQYWTLRHCLAPVSETAGDRCE